MDILFDFTWRYSHLCSWPPIEIDLAQTHIQWHPTVLRFRFLGLMFVISSKFYNLITLKFPRQCDQYNGWIRQPLQMDISILIACYTFLTSECLTLLTDCCYYYIIQFLWVFFFSFRLMTCINLIVSMEMFHIFKTISLKFNQINYQHKLTFGEWHFKRFIFFFWFRFRE